MRLPPVNARAACALACLLVYMCTLGFAPIHVGINDKLLHFTAFAGLAAILYHLLRIPRRLQVAFAAVLSGLASIVSESAQGLLSYRVYDGYDVAANLAGSASGLLMVLTFEVARGYHQRQRRQRNQPLLPLSLQDFGTLDEQRQHPTIDI